MKESGVPGVGLVPAHWRVCSLKSLASLNDDVLGEGISPEREIEYVDIGSVSLEGGILNVQKMRFGDAPSRARRLVRHGDVIVSTVRTYLKAIAPIERPSRNLVVSTGFAVIRPRAELSSSFAKYYLQGEPFTEEIVSRSKGVSYPAINAGELGAIPVVLPPLEEQVAIAQYLKEQIAAVDLYSAVLLERKRILSELRAAVGHQAVTRGLSPSVEMTDMGLGWVDEVPAHWKVARLKELARMRSGESITALSIDEEGPYPVFGGNGVRGYGTFYTHEGDYVLIGRQGALCGNIHYASGRFWASEHAVVVAPRRGVCLGWLGEMLRAMDLNQYSLAAAQPGLSVGRILNLWTAVPPLEEQVAIAAFLQEKDREFGNLAALIDEQQEMLRRLRASLVFEAVTGKVDVRGGASHTGDRVSFTRSDACDRDLERAISSTGSSSPILSPPNPRD